jgi:hypothetical protein
MKTHVFVILDRSGSMSSCQDATIKGYNEYLEKMQAEKDVRWNLCLFDDKFESPVTNMGVTDVPKLTPKTFVPRGSTALVDATCRTLNDAKSRIKDNEKALVVVITDGYENASHEYSAEQMKNIIKELEAKKNWTFTYLGADQDAWSVAQHYGFTKGNTVNYSSSSTGVGNTFTTMSVASSNLVRSAKMSLNSDDSKDAFYTAAQKKNIEETK